MSNQYDQHISTPKCPAKNQAADMSKPLDATLSREIAKRLKTKSQNNFDKAYEAALLTPEAIYVQGFLARAGEPYKPIEHGWLELETHLVDPSLPQLGQDEQELFYFPAQRLSVKQLQAAVEEAKEDYPEDEPLPVYGDAPYEYYGDRMLGGLDYKVAYEEALAKCRELNKPQSKKPE
jgi:hypothetical protein